MEDSREGVRCCATAQFLACSVRSGASDADRRLGIAALARVMYGGSVAFVGQARTVKAVGVGKCVRVVARNSGSIGVGTNDNDPRDNFGYLAFFVKVTNPTPAEWLKAKTAPRGSQAALPDFASNEPTPVQARTGWRQSTVTSLQQLFGSAAADKIATQIQRITHPTGGRPSFGGFEVGEVTDDSLSVTVRTAWHGGFSGSQYSTVVVWQFDRDKHISISVVSDNAPFAVAPANAHHLDEFFRLQLYRGLRTHLGD